MCGITGFFSPSIRSDDALARVAEGMTRTLEKRGPDDFGVWTDADRGIALGHRRLAIIDLSAEGHQPMTSACGRYVVSFNGEIYNFTQLRRELEQFGHRFRGHSDTEVMLSAFTQWGLSAAIPRLDGMFAFAVWDRVERVLHLVRDRVGEKPLYYGWMGDSFVFGSELKAIRAYSAVPPEVDREALALYLRYSYVPTPYSIYKGLYKLPPGCTLAVSGSTTRQPIGFSKFPSDVATHTSLRPITYWSARDVISRAVADPFRGSEEEATDQLDYLLRDSIKRQMVSDVPLGALLSGGVDSSTVVALMQVQSNRPVQTFTIGFREPGFDEAVPAGAVSRHLGTEHTELYVSSQDALGVVDQLPAVYDEPFADSSQIPTLLLCGLIRRHVTVALSGDGGDELFGGYNRYNVGNSIWRMAGRFPKSLKQTAARLLRVPNAAQWDSLTRRFAFFAQDYGTQGTFGDKFHKLADVLAMPNPEALYHRLVTFWERPASIMRAGDSEGVLPLMDPREWADTPDFVSRMMSLDLVSYLPDDILTKVDRASMAASLEVRVPMLDHRIVEFAWRLPTTMKIRDRETKRILRRVLYRYVPRPLIERPKMGFAIPLAAWLKGPLREWAEELLDERRLRDEGFFDPKPIQDKWREHLAGTRNWQALLWCVLMFQAWNRQVGSAT